MISRNIEVPLNLNHGTPRSSGIHLSGILKVAGEKAGWLQKRDDEDDLGHLSRTVDPLAVGKNATLMRAVAGHAWEGYIKSHLFKHFPLFVTSPGEFVCDGIIFTPDAMSVQENGSWLLHECKATWKYQFPAVESNLWMYQIGGYLYGLSSFYEEPVLDCVMHVFHFRRDAGIDPIYLPQLISFEETELKTLWNEILKFKDQAIPELHEGLYQQ